MRNMKLSKDFLLHQNGLERLVVSTGSAAFAGLVRSNKTAARILDCLAEGADREQIIDRLEQQYDAPRDRIAQDVDQILSQLRQIGAIDDDVLH